MQASSLQAALGPAATLGGRQQSGGAWRAAARSALAAARVTATRGAPLGPPGRGRRRRRRLVEPRSMQSAAGTLTSPAAGAPGRSRSGMLQPRGAPSRRAAAGPAAAPARLEGPWRARQTVGGAGQCASTVDPHARGAARRPAGGPQTAARPPHNPVRGSAGAQRTGTQTAARRRAYRSDAAALALRRALADQGGALPAATATGRVRGAHGAPTQPPNRPHSAWTQPRLCLAGSP